MEIAKIRMFTEMWTTEALAQGTKESTGNWAKIYSSQLHSTRVLRTEVKLNSKVMHPLFVEEIPWPEAIHGLIWSPPML